MEIKKKELEIEKNEQRRPKRNNPKLITQSGETYNPSDKIGIKQFKEKLNFFVVFQVVVVLYFHY